MTRGDSIGEGTNKGASTATSAQQNDRNQEAAMATDVNEEKHLATEGKKEKSLVARDEKEKSLVGEDEKEKSLVGEDEKEKSLVGENEKEKPLEASNETADVGGQLNTGPSVCRQLLSWRAVMYLLLHLSFAMLGLPRTTTNMAIVCTESRRQDALARANTTAGLTAASEGSVWLADTPGWGGNSTSGSDGYALSVPGVDGDVITDLKWDPSTKGLVLSAPLFLSWTSAMIADVIRQKLGSRRVLTGALLLAGALTLISPELARLSPYFLMVNQIIVGLTMSANVPVIGDGVARWTPLPQRITANFIIFGGIASGAVINSLINSSLCSVPHDNGWPFIYYVSGLAILTYAVAWHFLSADSPETHPYISNAEKDFLLVTRARLTLDTKGKRPERPPYMKMLRSPPVLAFINSHICLMWSTNVIFIMLPLYLNGMLGFTVTQTGAVFSGIICCRYLGGLTWMLVGNLLTNWKVLSAPITRKACLCSGMTAAACASVTVSLFDHTDRWAAVALLILTLFLAAVNTPHLPALPQEMGHRYAGSLLSLSTSIAILVGMTGPLVVTTLTPTGSYEEWRVVWLVLAGVYLNSSLVFLIFGQARLQPWGETKEEEDDVPAAPAAAERDEEKGDHPRGCLLPEPQLQPPHVTSSTERT